MLGWSARVLFVHGLAMEAVVANMILRKPMVQKIVGDLVWERAVSRGCPVAFDAFERTRQGLGIEVVKALRTWWIRQADQVIVPSGYLRDWIARLGVKGNRVHVVPNSVMPVEGLGPSDAPLDCSIKAVTVCRLVVHKRVDHVIRAVAAVERCGLVIIGDGPERRHLEDLVRSLGVTDRVYFAGHRSREETLSMMATCDIFVLASTYEGFPHVLLEAMGAGMPVVAAAVGGVPELVIDGETGILVDPRRPDALREAVKRLAERPAERNMMSRQSRRAFGRYSFEVMVRDTDQILRSAALRECASA
jgi:glycosyltransferase involved in cell wall biosynthesis